MRLLLGAVLALSFSTSGAWGQSILKSKQEWSAHHRSFFTLLAQAPLASGPRPALSATKATVVAVLSSRCPLTGKYIPRLKEIAQLFDPAEVQWITLFPSSHETAEALALFAKDRNLSFPALVGTRALQDHLFLRKVPEVFVFDGNQQLVYRGKIDDQFRIDGSLSKARSEYLKETLNALISNSAIPYSVTKVEGCHIQSPAGAPRREFTYTEDIGPLIHSSCTYCHQPHEIKADLPLTDLAEVTSLFDTIEERVQTRLMPPWRADHRFGNFRNDLSWDIQQIHALMDWKESGFKNGAGQLHWPTPSAARVWRMGTPDAVIEMAGPDSSLKDPKGFEVPETGVVAYQHFRVKTSFPEDKWITAVEVRPSAPQVVHHVNAFLVKPGQSGDEIVDNPTSLRIASAISKKKYGISREELQWTFKLYGPKMNRRLYTIGNFNPMITVKEYPDGHGLLLPAGAEIVFECHYTPNGKSVFDNTAIGLKFAPSVPQGKLRKEVYTRAAAQMANIQIQPHSKLTLTSVVPFFADAKLLSLRPHMHNRGDSVTAELEFVDGRKETILRIPKWDYEWQNNYEFEPSLEVKKGTKLLVTYHWDNTSNNPKNPDPSKAVRYGLQFDNEMALAYPTYVYQNIDEAADAERELDDFLTSPESTRRPVP
jgi:hypothetical protein